MAGEAIWPPLVRADPRAAGIAAVVANVNDVAAMGGRPIAMVDTVVAPESVAREILKGMRWAAERYEVPVVGGHLSVMEGPPSLSAFVLGRASRVLASVNCAPGQILLCAACTDGSLRKDFPLFSSLNRRGENLAADVRVLAELADAGLAVAAKDVSMAGFLGSLAMLLEPTRCGAVIELSNVPRPDEIALPEWLGLFPSYGFFICATEAAVGSVIEAFSMRGIACAEVGALDNTARLVVRLGKHEAQLLDLSRESVTGLGDGS